MVLPEVESVAWLGTLVVSVMVAMASYIADGSGGSSDINAVVEHEMTPEGIEFDQTYRHGVLGPVGKTIIRWPRLDRPVPLLPRDQVQMLRQRWDRKVSELVTNTEVRALVRAYDQYVEAMEIETTANGTIRAVIRFRNATIENEFYPAMFSNQVPVIERERVAIKITFSILDQLTSGTRRRWNKLLEHMRRPRTNNNHSELGGALTHLFMCWAIANSPTEISGTEDECAFCKSPPQNNTKFRRCKCHAVRYCSTDCQRAHWGWNHHLHCTAA